MEIQDDKLGKTVVLSSRNVRELSAALVILIDRGETSGTFAVLRKLNLAGDEFLTIAIDLVVDDDSAIGAIPI